MSHEIYLCDPFGNRLVLLDTLLSLRYSRVVNGVGAFSIALPEDFDSGLARLDGRVELWRARQLQMIGFVRHPRWETDANGLTKFVLAGVDLNDLLRRRIVAYAADSAQAKMTGLADDLMKAIVIDALGADAGAGRDLTALGVSVQANLSQGPTLTKAFAWRKWVLTVLQELSDAAVQAGVPVYFDIVPTSTTAFEFRTFLNQRGIDHSAAGAQPVVIGIEFGNLASPWLDHDYTNEANVAYVGGQGEGANRAIVTRTDAARIGASPWNRRETFVDARNESDTNGLNAAGDAALEAGRPAKRFGGQVLDTDSCRYGIEWGFGDQLTATYLGQQYTARVRAVTVSVDESGNESVDARLETTT